MILGDLHHDLACIKPQHLENHLDPMAIEWKASQIEIDFRGSVQLHRQRRRAVGPYAQHDPARLEGFGFIDQHHLRKPARRKLVELIITLEHLLVDTRLDGIESLTRVAPLQHGCAGELEDLVLIVDEVNVMQLDAGLDRHRSTAIWRAEHERIRRDGTGEAVDGLRHCNL